MATSFTEILEVKTFLRQQHIIVSEEWTEACITFLKQEQQVSSQNLKKRVHQQWLIADLEEIACSSLPHELPTAQKMTLNGNFALQVQGIKDISRPAYSQLKQLTNSDNSNVEFSSAPKEPIPEWEVKPTRMLMMALTDGCIHVQGMEYRTINFLSPNFSPGIKVLIKGPIECRFGVLLLTAENISILGGAVESKLEQFSRENLLREQLHIERDDDEREPTEISTLNSRITTQETSYDSRTLNRNSEINLAQQNQINSVMPTLNSNPSSSLRNYGSNSSADVLDNFDSDDDFDQNIDYGVLDQIENSQIQNTTFNEADDYDPDVWQEDEDVLRDHMEFQDANPEFKMPFKAQDTSSSAASANKIQYSSPSAASANKIQNFSPSAASANKIQDSSPSTASANKIHDSRPSAASANKIQDFSPSTASANKIQDSRPSTASSNKIQDSNATEKFTTLSKLIKNPVSESVVTIKGYIIKVLSKLECTKTNGFSLSVKINDGTAKIDADIHNKVLEGIIGESAETVIKKQVEAASNMAVMKELMQSISKCKLFLQNYNFLMDIKFLPGEKPCIIKCVMESKLHMQQLLERASSHS